MNEAWFALQVRNRHECLVAVHLSAKGYTHFLPLQKSRHRWSDRFKELERPLFPGYIFCRFDPLNRLPILVIPGVALIVGIAKTPTPIDQAEIAAIEAAVKSGLPTQPCPFLQVGQRVRIDRGPLSGIEGILQGVRSRRHLILSVTLLQRSIALQVEDTWVTPLPPSAKTLAHDSHAVRGRNPIILDCHSERSEESLRVGNASMRRGSLSIYSSE